MPSHPFCFFSLSDEVVSQYYTSMSPNDLIYAWEYYGWGQRAIIEDVLFSKTGKDYFSAQLKLVKTLANCPTLLKHYDQEHFNKLTAKFRTQLKQPGLELPQRVQGVWVLGDLNYCVDLNVATLITELGNDNETSLTLLSWIGPVLNKERQATLIKALKVKLKSNNDSIRDSALNCIKVMLPGLEKEILAELVDFIELALNDKDKKISNAALTCLQILSPRLKKEVLLTFLPIVQIKLDESDKAVECFIAMLPRVVTPQNSTHLIEFLDQKLGDLDDYKIIRMLLALRVVIPSLNKEVLTQVVPVIQKRLTVIDRHAWAFALKCFTLIVSSLELTEQELAVYEELFNDKLNSENIVVSREALKAVVTLAKLKKNTEILDRFVKSFEQDIQNGQETIRISALQHFIALIPFLNKEMLNPFIVILNNNLSHDNIRIREAALDCLTKMIASLDDDNVFIAFIDPVISLAKNNCCVPQAMEYLTKMARHLNTKHLSDLIDLVKNQLEGEMTLDIAFYTLPLLDVIFPCLESTIQQSLMTLVKNKLNHEDEIIRGTIVNTLILCMVNLNKSHILTTNFNLPTNREILALGVVNQWVNQVFFAPDSKEEINSKLASINNC